MKLVTETKTLEAHKLFLSSYSPYFRKLFEENPKTTSMHFKDIPASHLEPLIDYMYTGNASTNEADILETARSLQITGYRSESRPCSASSGQFSSSGKRKAYGGGRKSSNPIKLRQNSRDEPEESALTCVKPVQEKHVSAGQEHVITPTRPSCYDDIAASEDEGELVIDQQPVNFSPGRPSPDPLRGRGALLRSRSHGRTWRGVVCGVWPCAAPPGEWRCERRGAATLCALP